MYRSEKLRLAGLCALFAIFGLNAAIASPFVVPLKGICTASKKVAINGVKYQTVNKKKLINRILETQWLSGHNLDWAIVIDTNDDGTEELSEKLAVLTNPRHCDQIPKNRDQCSKNDRESLSIMRFSISATPIKGTDYQIVRATSSGASSDVSSIVVSDIVNDGRNGVQIACLKPKPRSVDRLAVGDLPDPADREGYAIRVTSKVEDLSLPRPSSLSPQSPGEKAKLAKIRPAEFSVTSNERTDLSTYQADVVLGYEFNFVQDNLFANVIPYVQIQRRFNNQKTNEVDKLAGGILADLNFVFTGDGADNLTIAAQYTTDSEAQTEIASLKSTWLPGFLLMKGSPIGFFKEVGPVRVYTDVRGALDYGHVYNDGGNARLSATKDYLHGGGIARLIVKGQEGTILSQFLADVSYKYLHGFEGQLDVFKRFEASLTYYLAQQQHFGITLSYKNGHVEETLQKEELIKASLVARF